MLRDKLFRSDLYYRLSVFPILAPSLRDHAEDIPLLARHFTRKFAAKLDRPIERISSQAMRALTTWTWPGNVRELENFIERSVILSPGINLCPPLDELRDSAAEDIYGSARRRTRPSRASSQ
jgi:formate hydrogenlyase transcriptional activator